MKKKLRYFFIAGTLVTTAAKAQVTDTLSDVRLLSKKEPVVITAPVNIQQLNKTALSKLNSLSVADAVKYFAGITVKDYGGIGGLKTISVRSLGANHTGVMYDGIMVADAQGGQIDLGKFSLDNITGIQLINNQPPDILLPARSYASAAILSLNSSATDNDSINLAIRLKSGSFGFINPSLYYKDKIGKHFSHGLSAEYQSADGDFSFIDYETGKGKAKRANADIKSHRLEYDAAYTFSDSNKLKLKVYYYDSKRGLPGSIILFNPTTGERLNNRSFFSQVTWNKSLSAKSRLLISSKYSTDYKYYLDPNYPNSARKLENEFHQREMYLSAAYSYQFTNALSAGFASDYFNSQLTRTDQFTQNFADPKRNTYLNNFAIAFKQSNIEINANLLHTSIREKVVTGPTGRSLDAFTPAVAAAFQPIRTLPVRVRASYKKIFRAPTFDDLYYTNIGNTNLRPEYANLYNAGFTVHMIPQHFINDIIVTVDGYYNTVKDKIIAVPRQNLFQWSMMNVGKVSIKGMDVAAHFDFKNMGPFNLSAHVSYTWQEALDITDPASSTYKTQLPYTPKNSGSASVNIGYKKWALNYNLLVSDYRYRMSNPIPENVVQGWSNHDVSASYSTSDKQHGYKFIAEVNNIANTQYEVIRYYPMPRFNYRVGVAVTFKKIKQS